VQLVRPDRLRNLVEVNGTVVVRVDDPKDLLGRPVHRDLLGEHLHHLGHRERDGLVELDLQRSSELRALLLRQVGRQVDLRLGLRPEEALARPVVVPKVEEELIDAERARTVVVGEIEERVGILVGQPAVHRLDRLTELYLVKLAGAVDVGVAEGVAHLLERPATEEVRHDLHSVLLRARHCRRVHHRLAALPRRHTNGRRPLGLQRAL